MRRTARLMILYALEAVAALFALLIFAAAIALWRLASGPVPADLLRPAISDMLITAVDGDSAEIGALTLGYDPAASALTLEGSSVIVRDEAGLALAAVDRFKAALALDLLLTGRAVPVSMEAEGGVVSLVRRQGGAWSVELGRADAFSAAGERLVSTPSNAAPPADALARDLAERRRSPILRRLQRIDLRNVEIHVRDEIDDLALIIDDARALMDVSGPGANGDFSGALITSAGRAPVAASFAVGEALEALFLDIRVRDLVPATAAPRRGPFAMLGRLDASVQADIVINATREAGLEAVLVDLSIGPGQLGMDQDRYVVEGAQARLALDTAAGELNIDALSVRAELLEFDASGRVFGFTEFRGAIPGRAEIQLDIADGRLDLTGFMPGQKRWNGARLEGVVRPLERQVEFSRLDIDLPEAGARFTGGFGLRQVEDGRWLPDIALSGPIAGELTAPDVLSFWPVDFALGARDWIEERIIAGTVSDAVLNLDISADALAERMLQDPALSLAFAFTEADVRYISTMTPLTGLSGTAELRGNSLSLLGSGAEIGALEIEEIFVEIPRLNPKGAIARFGGRGRGEAADVMALIDEDPLNLATDYGIDPAAFSGQGVVEFEIGRAMRRFVPPEDIDFDVSAVFENVSGPAGAASDLRFTEGEVAIEATPDGLVGQGSASLAGARADIVWRETFNLGDDALSTQITLSALADGRILDRVGLPVRRFLDGVVGVNAQLSGNGFEFAEAAIVLDLEQAALALPGDVWEKAPGDPGELSLLVRTERSGALALDQLRLSASGAEVEATAMLAPDGRLLSANAPLVRLDQVMELALLADRPDGPDGALRVRVTGPYLNGQDLLGHVRTAGFGGGGGAALSFAATVDRVEAPGMSFQDVDLVLENTPVGLAGFALSANSSTGPVEAYFGPQDDQAEGAPRVLSVSGEDAGLLLAAFTGFDNVSGGALSIEGSAPPLGQTGGVQGQITVEAFTLDRMPLLARVLAAGSLEGLAGLMSGEGIVFEQLRAGFDWEDGVLEMRAARAAGPSLGVTWAGVVDLRQSRLDVDGTLLPSYGINSVLGALPVLGGLLTSREGEGVVGITFSVSGPFEQTRVFANPLSALAPGVFRRIFEGTSAARELEALEARRAAEAETSADRVAADADEADEPDPSEPVETPPPSDEPSGEDNET
ncbi:MAG: AsmA-like C-terminal region-containing protein [Pseudomonadota bacterium]